MSEPLEVARRIFMNDESELRCGWRVLRLRVSFYSGRDASGGVDQSRGNPLSCAQFHIRSENIGRRFKRAPCGAVVCGCRARPERGVDRDYRLRSLA